MRMVVVFPAPLGPRSPQTLPRSSKPAPPATAARLAERADAARRRDRAVALVQARGLDGGRHGPYASDRYHSPRRGAASPNGWGPSGRPPEPRRTRPNGAAEPG